MYDSLVLSGGGIKGLLTLGAVQCCMDSKILSNCRNFIGTSSGSMICYLLCIGYTPTEILVYISVHNSFDKIKEIRGINDGFLSFSNIQEVLEDMTMKKIGYFPKMKDIKEKFNKNLKIVTYNETLQKQEIITSDTHPELPCMIAIHMSSNIPFIFERFKYQGSFFLDGGLVNNFPVNIADNDTDKTLGIAISMPLTELYEDKPDRLNFQYIIKVMLAPIRHMMELNIKNASENCDILRINTKHDQKLAFDFTISSGVRLDMFVFGYETMKKFLNEKSKTCKEIKSDTNQSETETTDEIEKSPE
jgi:predicted acylesterase/phospholipase RssA